MPRPLPINLGTPSTRRPIYNSLTSAELSTIAVTDPSVFNVIAGKETSDYALSIANQINKARNSVTPRMVCVDLVDFISDIVLETAAQGSGILSVHLIDPGWELLKTQPDGKSFIDVDPYGYLWPPIEVNFPEGKSDALWRLAQVNASTDTTNSNLSLVFEDAIVAELREHDKSTDQSCAASYPNETRAEFIRRCIKTASRNPQDPADIGIRFIPLLPNSVFTPEDLYGDQTSPPTSSLVLGRNYLKTAQGYNKTHTGGPSGPPILAGVDPFTPFKDTLKWTGKISIASSAFGAEGIMTQGS